MTEVEDAPVERRGRKTKEQEVRDFLRSKGVDLDLVLADAGVDDGAPMPQTFAEMRDAFARLIWSRRNSLSDTALSKALGDLARLASLGGEEPGDAPEPLLADVISGIALLPDERRREILTGALAGLDAERARIMEVLDA